MLGTSAEFLSVTSWSLSRPTSRPNFQVLWPLYHRPHVWAALRGHRRSGFSQGSGCLGANRVLWSDQCAGRADAQFKRDRFLSVPGGPMQQITRVDFTNLSRSEFVRSMLILLLLSRCCTIASDWITTLNLATMCFRSTVADLALEFRWPDIEASHCGKPNFPAWLLAPPTV